MAVEMVNLRLKYAEVDVNRRQEIARLKAMLHLPIGNTTSEVSSPLLQYPVPEVICMLC